LFIAIYNDQGPRSVWWTGVKKLYNRLPTVGRWPFLLAMSIGFETAAFAGSILRLDPARFVRRWTRYESVRGMSRWHDLVDWMGGFPFEVATPDQIFEFCKARELSLQRLKTCGGRMGCNEFVFVRAALTR